MMFRFATTAAPVAQAIPNIWVVLAWIVTYLAVVATLILISLHAVRFASTRVSDKETRTRAQLKRSERLVGICDGVDHAWNRLIEREAISFAQAHSFRRRSRRLIALVLCVTTPVALVAPLMTVANVAIRATGVVPTSLEGTLLVVIGGFYATLFGGFLFPMACAALLTTAQRDRMPLAWRVLARGSTALAPLQRPDAPHKRLKKLPRALEHELPVAAPNGEETVSTAMAHFLLDPLEAELVVTMTPSSRSTVGQRLAGAERDARRLAFLVREKASLLEGSGGEVPVRHVYAWLDLVASYCLLDPDDVPGLHEATAAKVHLDARVARRSLGLWSVTNGVITMATLFALSLACTVVGVLMPVSVSLPETVIERILTGIVLPVIAAIIVGFGQWIVRSLMKLKAPAPH